MRVVRSLLASALLTGSAAFATAAEVTLPAVQTGGIYADGGTNNDPAFQNYFVGYGTTPGFSRTAERRSFFHFVLPGPTGGAVLRSATLHLRLPFGGLIFGKGPGDPAAGPLPGDPTESFALGVLHLPSAVVKSPTLTAAEAMVMFGLMDDHAVASPKVFDGSGLPDPGDGGPPIVSVSLDDAGLAELTARLGADIVLTGWMPSWSEDFRTLPGGDLVEGSELIFGLTDVHALDLLRPSLTLEFGAPGAVPEPASWALLAAAIAGCALFRVAAARGHVRRRPHSPHRGRLRAGAAVPAPRAGGSVTDLTGPVMRGEVALRSP